MDQGATRQQSLSIQDKDENEPSASSGGTAFFEIHVRGHLDGKWSDWLEGLEVKLLDNGEMILRGPIVDQAALLGVLNKLGRLNLALLSVKQVTRKEREDDECHTNEE